MSMNRLPALMLLLCLPAVPPAAGAGESLAVGAGQAESAGTPTAATADAGATADVADAPAEVKEALGLLMPEVAPSWLRPAPVAGMWEVAFGPHIFYLSGDGRYLLRGDILEVKTRENLTRPAQNMARRDAVNGLGEQNMIIFRPEKVDYLVTVFTDVDCGYCAKLHSEIATYLEKGIEVRYVAFPRAGIGSDSYDKMVSVWCADDQQRAMTMAKARKPVEPKTCPNPVAQQYELGQMIGVRGTPTIVMDTGDVVPGYLPAVKLRQALEQAHAETGS